MDLELSKSSARKCFGRVRYTVAGLKGEYSPSTPPSPPSTPPSPRLLGSLRVGPEDVIPRYGTLCGYSRYPGVTWVLWGTLGYSGVLWGNLGTLGYSGVL